MDTLTLTNISRKIRSLRINLIKNIKNLYSESFHSLKKKTQILENE